MLIGLNIQHIALIDELQFDLPAGLNILTGETGAGKSVLLEALGLALGQRANGQLVRHGCVHGMVQAEFQISSDHPACHLLNTYNMTIDTNESLILRRQLYADGRSRCFINDQPVSNALLKQVGQLLVDIVAQFDQHRLHQTESQLELVDRFGNLQSEVQTISNLYREWQNLEKDYQEQQNLSLVRQSALAYDSHILAELDQLNPTVGEEEKLLSERQLLNQQGKVRQLLQDLYQDLQGEKGVSKNLGSALRRLERSHLPLNNFEPIRTALQQSLAFSQEALDLIHPQLNLAEQDAATKLEQIEERLSLIRELARKNQVTPDELPKFHEQLRQKLEQHQQSDKHIGDLQQNLIKCQQKLANIISSVHEKRCLSAKKLTKLVGQYLDKLHLTHTIFNIDVATLPVEQWNSAGGSRVCFLVSTNPGNPIAPMHKIASGGELSRFMLALKMALQQSDPVSTMIFDEIDTGVSGATAAAVGEMLALLARAVQLLVITHLPQVASQGDHHWLVQKHITEEYTKANVRLLTTLERQEEVARLIAGTVISDEARAAAKKLLTKPLSKKQHAAK
ncbi:MAG: DNA repair protein RecN [Alphaproteobacteria bacterium]|nr:DNA repair protein RecN [Alphaproteobacteria bacterium]